LPTFLRNKVVVKALRLKQVGIALAGLWLIVLIAAVAGTIYREIDGPTVRSTIAENLNLTALNSALNANLDSAQRANEIANGEIEHVNRMIDHANEMIDQLNEDLMVSQTEHAELKDRLDSYFTSVPLIQIPPDPWTSISTYFFP